MLKRNLCLLLIDVFSFYVALMLAFYTRKCLGYYIFPQYQLTLKQLFSLWWFPLIFIAFIALEGLYTFRFLFWEETRRLLKAITIATIVIFAIVSLGKMSDKVSRLTVIFVWFYSIFLFPTFRYFGKKILYGFSWWREPVFVIGDKDFLRDIKQFLEKDKFLGFSVVGEFSTEEDKNSVERVLENLSVDTLIVSISTFPSYRIEKFLAKIQKLVKHVFFVPQLDGLAVLNSEVYPVLFNKFFFLSVKNNLKSKFNKILKRIFDVIISIILLPFLLPLFGIIAVLIKLDSDGPGFFVHERIGEGGKVIRVLKFRTMYKDARERLEKLLKEDEEARKEWEANFKLKDDPRVTKVGKFLRKTSLDELPQIFNVLKGDMSLVGPRPVLKEELEKYYKEFAEYYYMVKPGITGLWQVSGRSDTDYEKRVKLDTWYVLNWSLWLDFIILIKTVEAVLKRKGAY